MLISFHLMISLGEEIRSYIMTLLEGNNFSTSSESDDNNHSEPDEEAKISESEEPEKEESGWLNIGKIFSYK